MGAVEILLTSKVPGIQAEIHCLPIGSNWYPTGHSGGQRARRLEFNLELLKRIILEDRRSFGLR